MGRYVYKHSGNGLIVDNLMKPLRKVTTMLSGKVIKPFAKKRINSWLSQAGEKVGKKAADKVIEKSGKLIRKLLSQRGKTSKTPTRKAPKATVARKVKTQC